MAFPGRHSGWSDAARKKAAETRKRNSMNQKVGNDVAAARGAFKAKKRGNKPPFPNGKQLREEEKKRREAMRYGPPFGGLR